MSERIHLSGSLKRKLQTQCIEKEKLLPRISAFFNRNAPENNSSLSTTSVKSTPAETTDFVSRLIFHVYNSSNKIKVVLKFKTKMINVF